MSRPNLLLITSDQQHWSTLGCLNPEIETPNLDRLAARGTLFNRAYCPNPTCTPTRSSIVTGQFPSQHGAYSLGTQLRPDAHTFGDDLAAAGYKTALVGKAHFQQLNDNTGGKYPSLESYPTLQDLDFWRNFKDRFYGFDHVELARNHTDEAHVGQHYAIWLEDKGVKDWRKYFAPPTGDTPSQLYTWNIPEEYHYNTWIAERSNALLDEYAASGENFCLWSSFFDPHPSYLVPEPWDQMYAGRHLTVPTGREGEHDKNPPHFAATQDPNHDWSEYREPLGSGCHGFCYHGRKDPRRDMEVYYGMVSCMDKYIGKILDKLEETGLADNTIIVFTSDHGHFFGQHGLTQKGAFHYEDVIRVPFIVSWPGHVPEGKQSEAIQSLVDIPVSFLKAAGVEVPMAMTGVDQLDTWTGSAGSARDHTIVENRHQPTTIHVKTYVDNRYKLTVYYNHTYGELFDLEADPGEHNNLWDDPASQALKQDLLLKLIHAELGKEPLPMPRVAGA